MDAVQSQVAELERQSAKPGFWDAPDEARELLGRLGRLRNTLESWEQLERRLADLKEMAQLIEESEGEEDAEAELLQDLRRFNEDLSRYELRTYLDGKDDERNAILTIHPGAGGTESQDWALMLHRMYLRWIERNGFSARILDFQEGEEAGIKDSTIEVTGPYAYGLLKAEAGVHRLVRISPFDFNKRRHTSFASVFVYPEVEESGEVEIREEDLRIDTYRSRGAGGQHVNKTESAVRITHIPTGIVVQCQAERSQHRNREMAMRVLRARLYHRQLEEQRKKAKELEATKRDIAWGSQIRSYVLHPYTMVKDHRTGFEVGDAQAVLDGDLNGFIEAWLKQSRKEPSGK